MQRKEDIIQRSTSKDPINTPEDKIDRTDEVPPSPEFIQAIALILENQMRPNDPQAQLEKIQSQEDNPLLGFYTFRKVSFTLSFYLERFVKYTHSSRTELILMLIYLERYLEMNKEDNLNEFNIHRLISTTLLIAQKYHADTHYQNSFFAKVGGLTPPEMKELEFEFIFRIKRWLMVTGQEYNKFMDIISPTLPQKEGSHRADVISNQENLEENVEFFSPNQKEYFETRMGVSRQRGHCLARLRRGNNPVDLDSEDEIRNPRVEEIPDERIVDKNPFIFSQFAQAMASLNIHDQNDSKLPERIANSIQLFINKTQRFINARYLDFNLFPTFTLIDVAPTPQQAAATATTGSAKKPKVSSTGKALQQLHRRPAEKPTLTVTGKNLSSTKKFSSTSEYSRKSSLTQATTGKIPSKEKQEAKADADPKSTLSYQF